MGFRYRKRIKLAPGVKLNLSKGRPSLSVGRPGATVNLGKRGARGTVGIPGTGLSYSAKLGTRTDVIGLPPPRERYIHNMQNIGLAALYLRDFDDMVSAIEYIYVTGVPSGRQAEMYTQALEERAEADRLCEAALQASERQSALSDEARVLAIHAFVLLAQLEAALLPGKPPRTVNEAEVAAVAQGARDAVLTASIDPFTRFAYSRAFVPVVVGGGITVFVVLDLLFGH